MKTDIIDARSEEGLKKAGKLIQNGSLVAFPTETVYGLGANALDEEASAKIYKAKGRPSDNPLIVHLSSVEDVEKIAYTNKLFYEIAEAFMPGPITVILPKKDIIPSTTTGGLNTVGIRIPQDKTARSLINYSGVPIAAPSANLSGHPSATSFEHVFNDLDGRIDAIIDGGRSFIGLESTIVSVCDGSITLLRPGAITLEMLKNVRIDLKVDKAVTEMLKSNETPLAPGMKYRHYAPRAKVVLIEGEESRISAFLEERSKSANTAVICFEEDNFKDNPGAAVIGSVNDKISQAHELFALLRDFDKRADLEQIYSRVPTKDGIGLAIYNRLIKASGFTVIKL